MQSSTSSTKRSSIMPPPSSGISFKRVFERVAQHLVDEDKVLIVALDDINYLFPEKEVDQVLYSLLRAHETCPGARMGVIGIMSELALNYVLDPRVVSVFQAEEVIFPPTAALRSETSWADGCRWASIRG